MPTTIALYSHPMLAHSDCQFAQQVSADDAERVTSTRVRVKPEININFRLIEVLR